MGGKRRRRAASSGDAGRLAETPGTYRAASSADSPAERDAAVDLFPDAGRLSVNERKAIGWGLSGKKNNEIATISGKSKRTTEKQMASALAKLGVDDREAALVMYHQLQIRRLLGRITQLERELAARDERIKALQRQLRRPQ
jgi:DNA-binding CsgD family transcriptional regulator